MKRSTDNQNASSNNENSGINKKTRMINNENSDGSFPTTSKSTISSGFDLNESNKIKITSCSKHNNPFIHLYNSNFNDENQFNDEYSQSTKFMWDYFSKNAQTFQCFKKKVELKEALEEMLEGVFPYLGVYIVGSSANGFGTCSSDVDICIMISHEELNQKTEALWVLRLIGRALQKASFIRKLKVIAAKVPIIKFHDTFNGIDCDINLNNHIGIRNTHLMKCYSEIDWRVKPLILNIKKWAKFQNINDASKQTISSYCLSLMTLFFLQNSSPPVVPVLQQEYSALFDLKRDIRELKLNENLPQWTSSNKKSIGQLFGEFLDYYSNFKYNDDIISVRTGQIIPRCWLPRNTTDTNHSEWKHLLIEAFFTEKEPFDCSNAARSVFDEYVFNQVKDVFKKSNQEYKKSKNINELFEKKFVDVQSYNNYNRNRTFSNNKYTNSDSDF